jgi:hypothetical protein
MSRILLDEGVPIGVRALLMIHDVRSAAEVGWAGLTNGDLIAAADDAGYEVMITADQNIRYQQNLAKRRIALVVLTTNHWDTIRANAEAIIPAVDAATPGSYRTVQLPKPPRRRRSYPRVPP